MHSDMAAMDMPNPWRSRPADRVSKEGAMELSPVPRMKTVHEIRMALLLPHLSIHGPVKNKINFEILIKQKTNRTSGEELQSQINSTHPV
jgi:hypothetical protein